MADVLAFGPWCLAYASRINEGHILIKIFCDNNAAGMARTRAYQPDKTFNVRLYGWVVRKGSWLNVGFGRQDQSAFPAHIEAFLEFLQGEGRLPPDMPTRLKGHAYLLYDSAPRPLAADGVLLIGDAAGLAYPRSGEGIRPAVESGLLAARAVAGASGAASPAARAEYESRMTRRFGARRETPPTGPTDWLPKRWRGPLAGKLLGTEWFARHFVVDRWFLHRHDPPLPPA